MTESEFIFQGRRVVTLTPDAPRGTIVWFHGGGWAIELGEDAIDWGRDLAAATGRTVLLPDYPLDPYPAPNAWCTDFWRHCAHTLPGPLVLAGDSAGAHLALCALPAARPDRALFVYAVTTLLPTRDFGSWRAYEKGWALSPRLMDYFIDRYCPDPAARYGASFSPARAICASVSSRPASSSTRRPGQASSQVSVGSPTRWSCQARSAPQGAGSAVT